jgi:integral membrane protein (TIGR01906 family)
MKVTLLPLDDRSEEAALGLIRSLAIGLFILAIPLALITTNIRVAISEQPVYDYAVRHYGAEAASGIPEPELLRANSEIHRYLTTGVGGVLAIDVQNQDGETGPLFSVRETAHMADVRDLVQVLFAVQVFAVALAIALAVVMLVLWPPRALAAGALYGSVLTAGVLALTGLVAVTGFDSAWTQFHIFAFSNDLWSLDPATDHLIQMFPETFWRDITMFIGGAIMFQAVLIAAVSVTYLILTRPRVEPDLPHDPRPSLPRPPIERPALPRPDQRHYMH